MKNTKRIGLTLLTTLIITSVITPNASAAVSKFTISSVSVSVGTTLVWTVSESVIPNHIGDKSNITITAIGLNTKFYPFHVIEVNGTMGWYNVTTNSWFAQSSVMQIMAINNSVSLAPGSVGVYMGALYIIPNPTNLTWLNLTVGGAYNGSGNTLNFTSFGNIHSFTYNTAGIATLLITYNSTHHVQEIWTLDVTQPFISFADFFLGISAVAIIGLVIVLVKKQKVLVTT